MSASHTYEKELETLILDTLLPVYEKYQKSKGVLDPFKDINSSILKQVRKKRILPALLRTQEN